MLIRPLICTCVALFTVVRCKKFRLARVSPQAAVQLPVPRIPDLLPNAAMSRTPIELPRYLELPQLPLGPRAI